MRNPCGEIQTPPDQWKVKWSSDPEKRERQLEYIIDTYAARRPWMEKYRDYWSGLAEYADYGEELPDPEPWDVAEGY